MLRLEHNGKKLNLEFKDGRYQATFIPTSPDDSVQIIHEDVVEPFEHTKDYYLSQMQLEHGRKSSAFDHNMSTKSMLGYLIEDLDHIELAMKDPESTAHGRFQLNHEAVLTEFINDDGTLKTNSQTIAGKILNRTSSDTSEMIQKMTPDIIQTTIQTADFMTVSKQTKDSLFNAIFDGAGNIVNAINQSPSGTTIKSDLIHLDGKVSMDNAFARNLLVDNLNTNDITAFMGKFSNVVAQNIDVNHLSGNKATFIQALFNGNHSNLRITGDGIDVLRKDGGVNARFSDLGMALFSGGRQTGIMQVTGPYAGWSNGLGVIAERGMYAYLGGRTNKYSNSNAFHPSIAVDGSSGDIILGSLVRPERDSQHSFKFGYTTTPRGQFPSISTNNGESRLVFARGDIQYIDSQNRINSIDDALSVIRR